MDSTQFVARLKELGISINIQKLRRWSKQGLIPDYETYYQPRQKKRGRPPNPVKAEKEGRILEKARLGRVSKWPKEALEEAAAVWAVRYINNDGRSDGIKVTAEAIELIRGVAAMVDKSPCAVYTLPPIAGPLSTRHIVPEDIEINFVSEDFDGLDPLAGTDNAKKADRLNTLIITWITAIEKVRAWEAAGIRASIMDRHPELGGLMPAEIDFSRIDPWQVHVSCPWQITKPARVSLFWWSRPSNNKNGSRKFWRPPFPLQRNLSESDRNEVVLYENFVDTREFFKIEVGDREAWVKDQLEKTGRELEEKERELRRLGMDKTAFSTLVAMEQRAVKTLTEREKMGLKTAQEKLALEWHLAMLKTSFGSEAKEEG
jgi:hypothetical protein